MLAATSAIAAIVSMSSSMTRSWSMSMVGNIVHGAGSEGNGNVIEISAGLLRSRRDIHSVFDRLRPRGHRDLRSTPGFAAP